MEKIEEKGREKIILIEYLFLSDSLNKHLTYSYIFFNTYLIKNVYTKFGLYLLIEIEVAK